MSDEIRMSMIIVPPYTAIPVFDERAQERDYISLDADVDPGRMLETLIDAHPDAIIRPVGVFEGVLAMWYAHEQVLGRLSSNVEDMVRELSYERAKHLIAAGLAVDDHQRDDLIEESRYDVLEDLLCGTLHAIAAPMRWPGQLHGIRFEDDSVFLEYEDLFDDDSDTFIMDDRFSVVTYSEEFAQNIDLAFEHYVLVPDRSKLGYGPAPLYVRSRHE